MKRWIAILLTKTKERDSRTQIFLFFVDSLIVQLNVYLTMRNVRLSNNVLSSSAVAI